MLHGKKVFVHTTYRKHVHILYGQNLMSVQHIDELYIFCMDKTIVHTTYGQVVYMLYVQLVYICHI